MAHLELEPLRHMGLLERMPAMAPDNADLSAQRRYGDLIVEWRPLEDCAAISSEWAQLVREAIEPNVFFEPGFLLPAAKHLADGAGHGAILVWHAGAEPRQLLGFWPMRGPGLLIRMAAGFACDYSSSGAPLLHRLVAVEAATALLTFALTRDALGGGVLFRELALDGPAARALRAAATLAGLDIAELDGHLRAAIWNGAAEPQLTSSANFKARLRANARKLSAEGDLRLTSAMTPDAARDALELFLALEASGWKGRRGTAIVADCRDSAFYRSMVRGLAREGKAEVHFVEAGARLASGCVVLRSGGQAWYVKTAFDESLAALSPGTLLAYQVGELAHADPALSLIDSCTLPGSEPFERLWKGRVRAGDIIIAPGSARGRIERREVLRRQARHAAKRIWYAARGLPMPLTLKPRPAARVG
jgi:CelD/BcsL family acetyltransferase involved in cellulose biosynthesis